MTSGVKSAVTSTPEQQQKSPKTIKNNEEENIAENATIMTKTEETESDKKEEEKDEESEESELKQNESPQQNNESKQKIHLRPDEYNDGLWDAEPFYYTNGPTTARGYYVSSDEQSGAGKRQKRGLIYKKRENATGGAANEYECFQSHEGIVYRPGDHVFVESCREDPFLVGSIVSFKMKKRDQLLVKLLRYYRPNDVPELSYSLVTQARIEEGQYNQSAAAPHSLHCRELFSSETTLLFHVAALRGKCSVQLVKDLRTALAEIDFSDENAFFHCLNYNQESGRLASVQMSIKVGAAYQANIPSCSSSTLSDDPDRDELLYRPGYLCAETEEKYVKMARTFRTFSLMNNKRITMLEKAARTGDLLLDDAVVTLHRSGYSVMDAINTMQAIDTHLTTDSSFMNADDVKKFGKGIKQYGKNFNKINKDLLGNHRREQLIAFYYLWKKSTNATRPKPLGNAKRTQVSVASVSRRGKTTTTFNGNNNGIANVKNVQTTAEGGSPPPSTDLGEQADASTKSSNSGGENSISPLDELQDYASASETETEQLDQQSGGVGRACHHCFSSKSVDWHHAGHDRLLLMCSECRIFYKRYGQLRPVERPSTVPPCLLMPANTTTTSRQDSEEEDENEEPLSVGNGRSNRLRTRGGGRLLPHRTPSSLDLLDSGGGERLRGTPQKVEEEQQRRSTPLRNSAGKVGRKRGNRGGGDSIYDESTPTPPKGKRSKKGNATNNTSPPSSLPSNAADDSRTPSPPTTTTNIAIKEDNEQNESNNNTRKRISKKEKLQKEKINNKDKMESSDDNNAAKKVKLERADSHAGVVTPQPATETTATLPSSSPSPIENSTKEAKEEQIVGDDDLLQKISEKQQTIEASQVASPKNSPLPIAAATIISRKPVAKVEPLETNKEENKNEIENQQNQQQTSKRVEEEPSNNTTIICVDFSSDEEGDNIKNEGSDDDLKEINENEKEWEQDCGPLGEVDSTEIYRTLEGKKDFEGRLISIEYRTILERKLKRSTGLTCARTDIAYLESPERSRHNLQRRERERFKKEQERAARQQQQQKQMTSTGIGSISNVVPVVQPLKKMEIPAEFGGHQHQQPSLVYLPNGQCATLPCASVNQQQIPLHPMLLNGSLLHGNNIGSIPGSNPLLSQFNSFASSMQQHQPNDVASTLSVASTSNLPSAYSTLPASTSLTTPQLQQASFQQPHQQQHPLMGLASANQAQHQLLNNQQALQPSAATPIVNQSPAAAAALFQQQQENALVMQMLMGSDPRLIQQLQSMFHMQQQQQQQLPPQVVPPASASVASTATTNTASAPIPTPNIVAQQQQQQMLQIQQMQILFGLQQQQEQKQQLEQYQRQQQQKNAQQQRAGSVASTSTNIPTPHPHHQQHILNGYHHPNQQQHKLSGAGLVGQGNNNVVNPSQHFSQSFAQQKSKKETASSKNQHQQQNQFQQQAANDALVKQLFCATQPQNAANFKNAQQQAAAAMFALQQQQRLASNNNNNNVNHFQQPHQLPQTSNNNNNSQQHQHASLLAAEMEAISAAFQQQHNAAASNVQQQQQLQDMLAMLAAGGAGLSQQEQRQLEEQIRFIIQNQQQSHQQQQQKQIAAAAAQQAAQQQAAQQNAQQQQAQQQQQLFATLAAVSAAAGNTGPEQLIAAQQIAQQIALQQQQQQNQQPSSSTNTSAFFQQQQQQQFQQQFLQVMAMHQQQQQQNAAFVNNNQTQQITPEQHLLQLEMFRRQQSQNVSNLQQRTQIGRAHV